VICRARAAAARRRGAPPRQLMGHCPVRHRCRDRPMRRTRTLDCRTRRDGNPAKCRSRLRLSIDLLLPAANSLAISYRVARQLSAGIPPRFAHLFSSSETSNQVCICPIDSFLSRSCLCRSRSSVATLQIVSRRCVARVLTKLAQIGRYTVTVVSKPFNKMHFKQ
jgi:hypothetical protein